MIIKYRGQLYKRIDAGEKKIAEVLKRKLQDDLKKAQSANPSFASASIDVTGRIDETEGGELSIWLNFKGSAEEARRLTDLMGNSMEKTGRSLTNLPFFNERYRIYATVSTASGGGSRRKIGEIIVEPRKGWSISSNSPIQQKVGVGYEVSKGWPRRSEDNKDQAAADAARYAGDNLELRREILKYSDSLGRLDASLAREIKAIYAKCHQLAIKCKELSKKHDKGW